MGNGLTVRRSTTAGPSNLFRSGPFKTESLAGVAIIAPGQSPDGVKSFTANAITFHHNALVDIDTENFSQYHAAGPRALPNRDDPIQLTLEKGFRHSDSRRAAFCGDA